MQIAMKLKNSKYDETQKLKWWPNFKKNGDKSPSQIVAKLKNSNCDKTQKHKLWQNSNCDKTEQLIMWQNSSCDKTQIGQNKKKSKLVKTLSRLLSKHILTPWHLMICSLGSILRLSQCFILYCYLVTGLCLLLNSYWLMSTVYCLLFAV